MSATNWDDCPECLQRARREGELAVSDAESSYGKVSSEEYLAARDAANRDVQLDQTLREDYQVDIGEDGVFRVGYSSRCDRCGFKFEYYYESESQLSPLNDDELRNSMELERTEDDG